MIEDGLAELHTLRYPAKAPTDPIAAALDRLAKARG